MDHQWTHADLETLPSLPASCDPAGADSKCRPSVRGALPCSAGSCSISFSSLSPWSPQTSLVELGNLALKFYKCSWNIFSRVERSKVELNNSAFSWMYNTTLSRRQSLVADEIWEDSLDYEHQVIYICNAIHGLASWDPCWAGKLEV